MHVGGLRTALINYIFAKSRSGQFILRIEDTDQSRLVPEALTDICQSLEWAGIRPDEGPGYGGDYGPYIQSERTSIYQDCVQKLLDENKAYRCYCSEERLDLMRREQRRRMETPKYDGKCRSLPTHQIDLSKPHTIRFKMECRPSTLNDIIFGNITFDNSHQEGDPVIMKSDGMPVYHLANVVDDHFMNISHVIRGVEWVPSAYKHLQLYEAFGWEPPQYAHLPLMLNDRNHKISKRDADYNLYLVKNLAEQGYFPKTILSWILSSGGGFPDDSWYPGITLEEILNKFKLECITNHNARIGLETLKNVGLAHYNRMLTEDIDSLTNQAAAYIKKYINENVEASHKLQDQLRMIEGRICKLSDLKSVSFIWQEPDLNANHFSQSVDIDLFTEFLQRCLELSSHGDLNESSIDNACRGCLPRPKALQLLRLVFTDYKEGLRITEITKLLSQEDLHRRIVKAIDVLRMKKADHI